jgi:hypothetical protein
LATFKWPRKTKQPTFLTFPDIGDEDNRVIMIKAGKKRPVEVDASDMIKKLRAVEKPKRNNIGKRGKGIEAIRGIMQGNRPRYGVETVARYGWRTSTHSYRLFVSLYGQAHKKWGVPIRETLESFEFGVKYR